MRWALLQVVAMVVVLGTCGCDVFHAGPTDELITRIESVHSTFADVLDDETVDDFVEDFIQTGEAERDIVFWEDMQVAYTSYCDQRDLPLETRREVFRVVLHRSLMHDEDVLVVHEPVLLRVEDVREILAAFPAEPDGASDGESR